MLKIPKNNKDHWGLQFEAQFNLIPSFEYLNFYKIWKRLRYFPLIFMFDSELTNDLQMALRLNVDKDTTKAYLYR